MGPSLWGRLFHTPEDSQVASTDDSSTHPAQLEASKPPLKGPTLPRISIIDGQRVVNLDEEDELFYKSFSRNQRTRVRRKIDIRMLPVLCALYLFAQLDRGSIGNAKIEGLKEDTNMTDSQYTWILAIFFFPYCFLDIPSNLYLEKLKRPSRYLAIMTLGWGITMTCLGFARNYKDFLALRFLLGAFESGFYPAAVYLCSQWYHPYELAFRLSFLMTVAAMSGVISGLLAAAIRRMDGLGGYESWRWIFLLEGGATILLSIGTLPFLIDTPELSSRWLQPDEIRYLVIMRRIKAGRGSDEVTPSRWRTIRDVSCDWRMWTFGFLFHVGNACGTGLKFTIPSVIRGLGYSNTASQLWSAVPFIFGAISALSTTAASDKLAWRWPFTAGPFLSQVLGFAIVFSCIHKDDGARVATLVGLCFAALGVFSTGPNVGSWISNNTISSSHRAAALAFALAIGSLGGLTGSFIFNESQSPEFPLGFRLACGLAGVGVLASGLLAVSYWRDNRKQAALEERQRNGTLTTDDVKQIEQKMGLFRYTL